MTRVAVLLVGHMRTFHQTYKNLIKHLLAPYKVDLFIMTYKKQYNEKPHFELGLEHTQECIDVDEIKRLYSPYLKEIKVTQTEDFQYEIEDNGVKYYNVPILNRIKTMLKFIQAGGQMVLDYQEKNEIKYDVLVRTRPDIIFNKTLCLRLINPKTMDLYFFQAYEWKVSDFFVMGPFDKVISSFDIADKLEEISKEYDYHLGRLEYTYQLFLRLYKYRWTNYLLKFQRDFDVVRPDFYIS